MFLLFFCVIENELHLCNVDFISEIRPIKHPLPFVSQHFPDLDYHAFTTPCYALIPPLLPWLIPTPSPPFFPYTHMHTLKIHLRKGHLKKTSL